MSPDAAVDHRGFRPNGPVARAHSKRDHIALGGMLAKLADVGAGRAFAHLLVFLTVSFGEIVRQSIRSRRPTGFGKLVWTIVGFREGRRHPRQDGRAIFVDDIGAGVSVSVAPARTLAEPIGQAS